MGHRLPIQKTLINGERQGEAFGFRLFFVCVECIKQYFSFVFKKIPTFAADLKTSFYFYYDKNIENRGACQAGARY
jgi:hypothetical protein